MRDVNDGLASVDGADDFFPGVAGRCPGCAAVPGHCPPARVVMEPEAPPPRVIVDKPVLLACTADGNVKLNRFKRAGTDLSGQQPVLKEFVSRTTAEVQQHVTAYRVSRDNLISVAVSFSFCGQSLPNFFVNGLLHCFLYAHAEILRAIVPLL